MDAMEVYELSPLANAIVDQAIDNVNRKLVAGYRNKKNSRPNAKTVDVGSTVSDTLDAVSAESVMAVANRGIAWREVITKSLTRGISSLSTMQFDGEFRVKDGVAEGLKDMPNTPGVYVVYDASNKPVYVGDSANLQKRWHAGHMNEYRQGERNGEPYKLADEFKDGCTVRFIVMDSAETAAAVEAHLIRSEGVQPNGPLINSREELKTEQGTRSNIEAKKIKDSSGSTAKLAMGAATEALSNSGWLVLEQLSAAMLKALKFELVDVLKGGVTKLMDRVTRFFQSIWSVLKNIISQPLKILEGVFEFIVNALSKAISQVYMLARNILDLANSAWNLYKGAETMSTEELIQKITETVVVSGSAVIWNALDPVIESQLLPFVGPVAPYLAAAITAIGFGISSHYLQGVVPKVVELLISCKSMHKEALQARLQACEQLLIVSERNHRLVLEFEGYVEGTGELVYEMREQTAVLSTHEPVAAFDIKSLLRTIPGKGA
ncbi:GIY-YIG nuclease family protein [Pseudomonas sp. DP-17]|uniref:GIY-YIG nuclease family protein n=1 Tax=Pseudomonas sp. DP-17 TaxID=1580486 RepID=UPI001EFABA1E|nr:GIY-YIG nuclease family protein [Pseudomonas sp. DP-17]MCG8910289.1 GIY-YIG nuclease family protein [Pseudomonas sp. DP-17]